MDLYSKVDEYKRVIDKLRPFEGDLLKQLQDYYRIGLTWSSNALEGNTLTISETKVILEDGLTVGGKPLRETFETIGHANAYDFMFTLLDKKSISESDILTMHRMFYEGIDKAEAGRYRSRQVFISGSEYPVCPAHEINSRMAEFCRWIENEGGNFHPVVFAALVHKEFVFIHPFIDGNGRLGRLLMNTALIQRGYIPAVIPPVLRGEYISFLEQAHVNDKKFIDFIVERVFESEKEVVRLLHIDVPSQ